MRSGGLVGRAIHGGVVPVRCGCADVPWVQAFSMLFDATLSYRGSASGKLDTEDSTHPGMSPTDCQVLIRKGQLLCGMLDKKALGDSGGGLIHIIFNEEGFQAAANFISVVQFVVNNWMAHHSFSCGIGDTVADPDTMNKIAVIIQDAKGSVQEIIKAYQGGALEERPGRCATATMQLPCRRGRVAVPGRVDLWWGCVAFGGRVNSPVRGESRGVRHAGRCMRRLRTR